MLSISNTPAVKVSAPFNVNAWLPTVMPPARLMVNALNVGAEVNVLSGMVNPAAFVLNVILVEVPIVKVPVVLVIGVAPVVNVIALFRISNTPSVNAIVPLIVKA